MDLSTITVDDFKELFSRDFPYLPVYDAGQLYNAGSKIYYETTLLFYQCLSNGTLDESPEDGIFWQLYDDNVDNYVLDTDITKAFREAKVNLNQTLYKDNDTITLAYLYLTAHYLVNDLRASKFGISGIGENLVSGKSAGSTSENFSIPDRFQRSERAAFYAKTTYGMKYWDLTSAKLVGNVTAVCGWTWY